MFALFIASTVYYAGQEQTGTSLTLFAERYTDRNLFGWEMPAGSSAGLSSIYVILFAPAVQCALDRSRAARQGFVDARQVRARPHPDGAWIPGHVLRIARCSAVTVLPTWLVLCYLVQMWGDLCLARWGFRP